ncbi:hypothetical protein [Xenorhabdus koppenhoeferi]|uniref:ParE-like toxin domain-containing protein n=1 Tax=Xenorhabdus koppenhoeferi TaxID=351659 RepID=A0A1I7H579_9GAMM|nr:hypothetical protein [Xenorhabdus koppenhoeferi]CEE94251.1 conserved hypothetical protein [Xenorhabdus nematophila str. Anatoliense]SFU55822.1 hypothetical protein SAMN05421784_11167 [Xenorhabdus koppenhoeferi]
MMICHSRTPEKIMSKAKMQLNRFKQGERISRKVKCTGKQKGAYSTLKINVGAFWRLLSRDAGKNWELMTHERYNKEILK